MPLLIFSVKCIIYYLFEKKYSKKFCNQRYYMNIVLRHNIQSSNYKRIKAQQVIHSQSFIKENSEPKK